MPRPPKISTTAAIYKSHRICLTNHMGSISHHITPLVIHSLGGGHINTHTHTHTDVRTETILRNQAHAWFKKMAILMRSHGWFLQAQSHISVCSLIDASKVSWLATDYKSRRTCSLLFVAMYSATSCAVYHKISSVKLPAVLVCWTFCCQSFLLYNTYLYVMHIMHV